MVSSTSTYNYLPSYFAENIFLKNSWQKNILIRVDANGWIQDISQSKPDEKTIILSGYVLPGMLNVHSHAFQRAMAGLAESATGDHNSFWTWRETMYRFLTQLTPEDQQAIATQLYVEMLKAGFTSVGEFHYVHHQADGRPYSDRAETSYHIINAAKEVGIAITHMPVLYAHSGFGGQVATDAQRRFLNNEDEILQIISNLTQRYQSDPQITIGLAHHSLRAVTPEMLHAATGAMLQLNPNAPIHIHVAEQMKEVNECLAWSGERPVEWLLNNVDIHSQWCFVHATHMTNDETIRLANSGVIAGLCPTTEANLGDGIFNLKKYVQHAGHFAIGSDSHISVNMIEELRLLEYGQRLCHQERGISKSQHQLSIGTFLYTQSLMGGASALARKTGDIAIGKRADFIVLDDEEPALLYKHNHQLLDALIFASNFNPIKHVIAGGKHVINNYHHGQEEEIYKKYKKTLAKLCATSLNEVCLT